ncbi:hypothetical protein [Streptomyces griseorubiginosus]|uniref:hypothetical protein n=1 Tax=Streptomyces griseorubiginosus TaxID=67304 RepID=UPI0036E6557B
MTTSVPRPLTVTARIDTADTVDHVPAERPQPASGHDPIAAQELTATLYISAFQSRCGHCQEPTMMDAHRHTDVSGLPSIPGGGCGARFVDTASAHWAVGADDLRRCRPDLPVRDTPAS